MRPEGFPIWLSAVEPGGAYDLSAARCHVLGALYAAATAGLPTLADPGYEGAGMGVHTPVKQPVDGRDLDLDTRIRTMLPRVPTRCERCLGERCSPYSSAGGGHCDTSPPVPARSRRSLGPRCSRISSTTT